MAVFNLATLSADLLGVEAAPGDIPRDVVLLFLELNQCRAFAVVMNGLYERYTLCYAALKEVPGGMGFSFVELKPTWHVRGDCEQAFGTLYVVVPNSAEINTSM